MDILVIEDDELDRRAVGRLLVDLDGVRPQLRFAQSLAEARDVLEQNAPDLVLLDMGLPDSVGLPTVEAVVAMVPDLPVIVLTGDAEEKHSLAALAAGASDYLIKASMSVDNIQRAIRYSLERKRVELRVREQADLLNRTNEGIVVCGMDGEVRFHNQGARLLFGEVLDAEKASDFFQLLNLDANTLDTARSELAAGRSWQGEVTASDGRTFFTHWTASSGSGSSGDAEIVSVNSDITDRRAVEQQLRRSQRMEGVGALACGIAHDFNNLLAPLLMSVELAQRNDTVPQRLKEDLKTMKSCIMRGKGLVEQLLTFGRGAEGQHESLEVDFVLKEISRLVESTFPAHVMLELDAPDELWEVNGNSNQLYQAFLNLAVNARDAMPDGGTLRITAKNHAMDSDEAAKAGVASGDYLWITVEDDGPGIPAERQDKIFEPFFTTKERGQGTGLGLSTTLGIVKSHHGFISLDSEPGHGSRFNVYIPRYQKAELSTTKAGEPEKVAAGEDLSGRHVLVVDDNDAVVRFVRSLLEDLQVEVEPAANGIDALAACEKAGHEFDLVLSDVDMPGMNGEELVHRLRDDGHDVPVIFITGMNVTPGVHDRFRKLGAADVLRKPFSCDALTDSMRACLAKPQEYDW